MRIKIKFNKKAISFFSLIGVFSIILFLLIFIAYISPTKDMSNDIDFGKTTKEVDLITYKLAAENFFINEEIIRNIEKSSNEFTKTYGVNLDNRLKIVENSCKYNNIELWYNEKNKNEKTLNFDENFDEKISLCIPHFDENLENNFKEYLENNFEKDLSEDLKPLKFTSPPEVKIDIENNNNLKLNVIVNYEKSTKIGKIISISEKNYNYDISGYDLLLKSISNSISNIPSSVKSEAPVCIKKNQIIEKNSDSEIICIRESIISIFKTEFIKNGGTEDLFSKYEFLISDMKLKDDTSLIGYYAFKITVKNKKLDSNQLEFGIIFKDNIQTVLVKFEAETFLRADNTIKVRLFEPKDTKDITTYIIIYSYQDFFNKNTYPKYNEFINMLKTNLVPSDFEQSDFYDDGGKYFHSKDSSNLDLNLISVNTNFKENKDKSNQNYKDIYLYQIYNFQTKRWDRLTAEKPVYVYVFATDLNKNYYLEEVSGNSLKVVPQTVFGPTPLISNEDPRIIDTIKISDNIASLDNSFSFETIGYEDISFNNYDIYILKGRENREIIERCNGISDYCYYYSGAGNANLKNGKYLVTSNTEITSMSGFDKVLNLQEGILQSGIEYEILIVPVDNLGKGIVLDKFEDFRFSISNDNYKIEKVVDGRLFPFSTKIIPKDNKAPNPITSISLISNKLILMEDGKYYLQWTKNEENIIGLDIKYTVKDSNGNLKKQEIITVGLDGVVLQNGVDFASIEISKIIPIDSTGNKELILTYTGQTYTASYP